MLERREAAERGAVLIVDDEGIVQEILTMLLAGSGYDVESAGSAEEALARLEDRSYDLVLLDLMLPGVDGMTALKRIRERDASQTVVMMTAFGSVESAVEAMKIGAFHCLTKPFKNDEVLLIVEKALENRRLVDENRRLKQVLFERHHFEQIVGKSRVMHDIFRLIDQVAPSRSTVLIEGESGTGKELIAHALHSRSTRADAPFVVVNSNSIPSELLESILFGHVKGAFTGATHHKKGLFEVADGGSIFLDEISTIRSEVQAKLLRVMQEKEFLPLGSTATVSVDVRIIAATNVDLRRLVEIGEFREDLFYRLNVISIKLPPLRDRPEDIPLLAAHFLEKYNAENSKAIEGFSPRAMERMLAYQWPGNVRELENLVERAVVLASVRTIDESLLPPEIGRTADCDLGSAEGPLGQQTVDFYEAVERFERELIESTLARCRGVQKRAAEMLGLKATTLNEKIKRLGIAVRS